MHLKDSVCEAAVNVVGFKRFTPQPWITASTLEIIDKRRAAWLANDLGECRALNPVRNAALQGDRQAWAVSIADTAALAIQQGRTHDAFESIKRMESNIDIFPHPRLGWKADNGEISQARSLGRVLEYTVEQAAPTSIT